MRNKFWKIATVALVAAMFAFTAIEAQAAKNLPFNKHVHQFDKAVKGKTFVYVPIGASSSIARGWYKSLHEQAETLGINLKVLDPGRNVHRMEQLIGSEIPKKPDVMMIQTPNMTITDRVMQQAMKAGIYVIQINMASKTPTDAFVGANPFKIGKMMAEAATEACIASDAPSNKIALMPGAVTSQWSMGIFQAVESAVKANKKLKIVTKQAAGWDTKKAHDKAATILQAHPDLCAFLGMWGQRDTGIAQAVKQAGLQGQVKVITNGGASAPIICKYIRQGKFYRFFDYDTGAQGNALMTTAKFLLESGKPAGTFHLTILTPIKMVDKNNIQPGTCVLHKSKSKSGGA